MATMEFDRISYLTPTPPEGKPASMHDSARGSPEPAQLEDSEALDGFHQLVADINNILGPSNGIDSADVDVGELKFIMRDYKSDESEWEKYAFSDYSRAYTRNLVDAGNGKCNLLLLCWTPGKGSPIHDHANAHCIMKILKGRLRETLYAWPCERSDNPTPCRAKGSPLYASTEHTCSGSGELGPGSLQITRDTVYKPEQVAYMSDRLGLHRIENPSDSELAVSLHLYTPPNAAKHGCHIFNESTGKKTHMKMCHFYSEFGVKN